MKTAMQELIERLEEKQSMWDKKSKEHIDIANTYYVAIIMAKKLLEKEKEQIKKAFSDGQETPLNHPALPHYSNDEYYNDKFNLKN